jgi:hypothetical protein
MVTNADVSPHRTFCAPGTPHQANTVRCGTGPETNSSVPGGTCRFTSILAVEFVDSRETSRRNVL